MDIAFVASMILLFGIVIGIITAVPIAVSIGFSSFLAIAVILGGDPSVATMNTASRVFTGINSFTLLAIPFFILAGALMNKGGIAGRLVDAAKVMVGRLPHGLAHTNVLANGMFGAVSGAAVAAAAAVGTVMNPRLEKEGYNRPWAAAVNVASAPSGMLIPPSNTFIVYSLVSSTSIAALFIAGVGPGIIWLIACMLVVALTGSKNRVTDPTVVEVHPTFGQSLMIIWRAVPSLLMIVIVIGGILSGLFTATESSAIAVVYCLILGFIYKQIRVRDLPNILVDAGRTTAIVMLLVGVSSALSFVMAYARIPDLISETMMNLTSNGTVILIIMMVILLIVGTFMDPTPAILIFVPIFLPIVTQFGVDPVHFGTMVVYNLCVGVITPPVGNVLFVGARVAGLKIEPVIMKLGWFLLTIIIGLFLVAFVPQISLWLPHTLGMR
ncbi:TRAP transporter, DctM subunit [Raineyella antarctica]|uniref:TRAP transporter, DctM subunit n=1 Tax=Raineyella antarctica TaxID=1577474 RepID=A0A1G6GCR2_9ACTN|nr:TRAP transporter large permease [Raineyella antarctica]SDB79760.1 TRAP transporter, DctM subunit [Raineyella antarctica]